MSLEEAAALQISRPAPLETGATDPMWAARRALVPLDGSPVAETVLPFVERIACALDLDIALLRAVPRIPPQVIEGSPFVDDTERLKREAEAYLGTVAARLSAAGLRVSTVVRVGDAAGEILGAVGECEADLIAMTTHGTSALRRLLFGSVAEAVLHRAPVPVFIVRTTGAGEARKAA